MDLPTLGIEQPFVGPTHLRDAWLGIDQARDPQAYIDYLAESRRARHALATANPERWLAPWGLKPGHHVLDVGCGLGEIACLVARQVGEGGRVVGIDRSLTLLAEARRSPEAGVFGVEFRQGDALALELPDDSFDVTHARTLLQHLEDPARALREMVRVTRPGGRVLALEPDWDAHTVTATDRALTRRVVQFMTDSLRQGWIGRQLLTLFVGGGLESVQVEADNLVSRNLPDVWRWWLGDCVAGAIDAGAITASEGAAWAADLWEHHERGAFAETITTFTVWGTKPARAAS